MNYWVSRLNEIGAQYTGPTNARRFDAGADFSVAYHIDDSWTFSNATTWQNWRTPGTWAESSTACYPSVAGSNSAFVGPYTPANASNPACAPITGQPVAATSLITASLGADLTSQLWSRYLGESSWQNTSLIEWNPSRRFGSHIGYRHRHVSQVVAVFDGQVSSTYLGTPVGARPGNGTVVVSGTDLSASEAEQEEANEESLLFGVKLRPVNQWSINGDLEWTYADNQLTPIAPRHLQRGKLRSTYRFAKWGSLNGSVNLKEDRSSYVPMNPAFTDTGAETPAFPASYIQPRHKDHLRNYSLGASLTPSEKLTFDFGYTFGDQYISAGTCLMVSGSASSPLIPEGGNITRCLNVAHPFPSTATAGQAIPAILDYAQKVHTGYFNLILRPTHRVTLNFGADVAADSGRNDWLRADSGALLRFPIDQVGNVITTSSGGVPTPATGSGQVLSGYAAGPNPFQPLGTLAMSWIKPTAGVEFDLSKALTFKGQYNHYSYNEHGGVQSAGPIAPRDFDTNVGTLSLKYSF